MGLIFCTLSSWLCPPCRRAFTLLRLNSIPSWLLEEEGALFREAEPMRYWETDSLGFILRSGKKSAATTKP